MSFVAKQWLCLRKNTHSFHFLNYKHWFLSSGWRNTSFQINKSKCKCITDTQSIKMMFASSVSSQIQQAQTNIKLQMFKTKCLTIFFSVLYALWTCRKSSTVINVSYQLDIDIHHRWHIGSPHTFGIIIWWNREVSVSISPVVHTIASSIIHQAYRKQLDCPNHSWIRCSSSFSTLLETSADKDHGGAPVRLQDRGQTQESAV